MIFAGHLENQQAWGYNQSTTEDIPEDSLNINSSMQIRVSQITRKPREILFYDPPGHLQDMTDLPYTYKI